MLVPALVNQVYLAEIKPRGQRLGFKALGGFVSEKLVNGFLARGIKQLQVAGRGRHVKIEAERLSLGRRHRAQGGLAQA